MGSGAINAELLQDLARHQAWADTLHWKALHENSVLVEDHEIRKRLNPYGLGGALAYGSRPRPNTGRIGDEGYRAGRPT